MSSEKKSQKVKKKNQFQDYLVPWHNQVAHHWKGVYAWLPWQIQDRQDIRGSSRPVDLAVPIYQHSGVKGEKVL